MHCRNNLAAIAFPETAVTDLLTILIVVRDGSSIERLENLREKSACFPEYGGIGEYFTIIIITMLLKGRKDTNFNSKAINCIKFS